MVLDIPDDFVRVHARIQFVLQLVSYFEQRVAVRHRFVPVARFASVSDARKAEVEFSIALYYAAPLIPALNHRSSRPAHFAANRLRDEHVKFVLLHGLWVESRFLEHLQKLTVKRIR